MSHVDGLGLFPYCPSDETTLLPNPKGSAILDRKSGERGSEGVIVVYVAEDQPRPDNLVSIIQRKSSVPRHDLHHSQGEFTNLLALNFLNYCRRGFYHHTWIVPHHRSLVED
jgi:hypothetical protein